MGSEGKRRCHRQADVPRTTSWKLRTKACAKQSLLRSKEGSVASLFLILFARMTIARRCFIVHLKSSRRAMNWHSANKRNNKLIPKKPTIRSRGSLRKRKKKKSWNSAALIANTLVYSERRIWRPRRSKRKKINCSVRLFSNFAMSLRLIKRIVRTIVRDRRKLKR